MKKEKMAKSISKKKLSNAQIKKLIQEALAKLPEEDRALITALYFDNVSVHKLAKQLGISRAAVRYRRRGALKKLRDMIKKG